MSIESVFPRPKQHVLVEQKRQTLRLHGDLCCSTQPRFTRSRMGLPGMEGNPLQGNNVDSSITKSGMSSSETRPDEIRDSLWLRATSSQEEEICTERGEPPT